MQRLKNLIYRMLIIHKITSMKKQLKVKIRDKYLRQKVIGIEMIQVGIFTGQMEQYKKDFAILVIINIISTRTMER